MFGAPAPNKENATSFASNAWALIHPALTARLLSGKIKTIGQINERTTPISCTSYCEFELVVDKTVSDYVIKNPPPNSEFYIPTTSQRREGAYPWTYDEDDNPIWYYSVSIAAFTKNRGSHGKDVQFIFAVNELTSERIFTVLNVFTSIGAMLTWIMIAYRLLFGSLRIRPFGIVQQYILRHKFSTRLKELYGRGWDKQIASSSLTRSLGRTSKSKAGTVKEKLGTGNSMTLAAAAAAAVAAVDLEEAMGSNKDFLRVPEASDPRNDGDIDALAPVADGMPMSELSGGMPTSMSVLSGAPGSYSSLPQAVDGVPLRILSGLPASSASLARSEAAGSRSETVGVPSLPRSFPPSLPRPPPLHHADIRYSRTELTVQLADLRRQMDLINSAMSELPRRVGFLEEMQKIIHDSAIDTDEVFDLMGLEDERSARRQALGRTF